MKREKFLLITTLLVSLFVVACPKPPEEDVIVNPYEQHPIDWPSLADSPWPMFHHDPQSTGRSEFVGPVSTPSVRKILANPSESGVVVGYDSTIITSTEGEVFSFKTNGEEIFRNLYSSGSCTPLISCDSIIYIIEGTKFAALELDGSIRVLETIGSRTNNVEPNIDKEGNFYSIDDNSQLNVVNPNGEVQWRLQDTRLLNGDDTAPTFSPDGGTIYLQAYNSVSIIALNIETQSIEWTFGNQTLLSSPVVDNDGNLYFVPGVPIMGTDNRILYSINSEGEIRWQYPIICDLIWDNTEVTIDHDGNIYFASDTLYSFTNDGELRWKYGFEESVQSNCPLICDANNTVYVGARSLTIHELQILAVNQDGNLEWIIRDNVERALGPSAAITSDGKIIYPTWSNYPGAIFIIE